MIVVAAPYLYLQLDSQVRRSVRAKLREGFPGYRVSVNEAQWLPGRGLQVRGVLLQDPSAPKHAQAVVQIDELFLHTTADLADLVAGDTKVRRITLRGLQLTAFERPDGGWTTAGLWPLPNFGGKPERIDVEQSRLAIVSIDHSAGGRRRVLEVHDLRMAAEAEENDAWRVVVKAAAEWCPTITAAATIDESNGTAELKQLAASNLAWSQDLVDRLPEPLRGRLQGARALTARIDVDKKSFCHIDLRGRRPPIWRLAGSLEHGRFWDDRLPWPLHDVGLSFEASSAGVQLSAITARLGDARLRGEASVASGGDFHLAGNIVQLHLTAPLLAAAARWAPDAGRIEREFHPNGEVDLEFVLDQKNGRLTKDVTATCRDLDFTARQFPYRVEHASGVVRLEGDHLTARLGAAAGARPIRIAADLMHPGPLAVGTIDVSGEAIRVTPEVLAALDDGARVEIERLHPQGAFDFVYRLERTPRDERPRHFLQLNLLDGSVRHEAFPYPLTNVRGVVRFQDERWTLGVGDRPLVAAAGDGDVTCRGVLIPQLAARGVDPLLSLAFVAQGVALDGRLHHALPPESQARWAELQPQGVIDFAADFVLADAQSPPHLEVRAQVGRLPVSVRPRSFPYRLERLAGAVTHRDGVTRWKRLEAWHNDTKVSCKGLVEQVADGRSRLMLENLVVDWNARDRELVDALPLQLRDAVTALAPQGWYQLSGVLELLIATPTEPFGANWNLTIDAAAASLTAGVDWTNLYGRLEGFRGRIQGDGFEATGRLTASSAEVWGHQIRGLDGPLVCNSAGVLVGRPATPGASADPLRATLYDGVVEALARYDWSSERYQLDARLNNADLGRFAIDHLPGRQSLLGKADATLRLAGVGPAKTTVTGAGEIHLRDAYLYELPVMVSLLKLLSVRSPDATAFTESRIDYVVQGDVVRFPKIEFLGDAVSLSGDGALRFPDQIDLVFSARLGRRTLPLVGGLLNSSGEQWRLLPVHVQGSLYDPVVTIEAFPTFSDAVERMQTESSGSGGGRPPRLGARGAARSTR